MKTMALSMNQVTISVKDIDRSFSFYHKLGLVPIVRNSHYVRFLAPGNEATFSLHVADKVESTTMVYFETANVDEKVESLFKLGFDFELLPTDQDWQWREAYLIDPDGNRICIYQAGSIRLTPEWRLEESKESHMLTAYSFRAWLEKYKSALGQKNPALIGELFSKDAQYFESPFDTPLKGISMILEYWNNAFLNQTSIIFNFDILHTFNNKGIAKWDASFIPGKNESKVWLNGVFEAYFNSDIECTHLHSWWHRKENV